MQSRTKGIYAKFTQKKKKHSIFFTMPDSPDTVVSAPRSPNRELSPADVEGRSPLYQSLMAALDMPNAAKREWLETVADFKNNPRALHLPPYNDGALHFVDKDGYILPISFPAVLDLHGRYARLGPYFNMTSEHGIKVTTSVDICNALLLNPPVRSLCAEKIEGPIRAQASCDQRL
jgi:hypothetical protein